MLEFLRAQLAQHIAQRSALADALDAPLDAVRAAGRDYLTDDEKRTYEAARSALLAHDAKIAELRANIAKAEEEEARAQRVADVAAELGTEGPEAQRRTQSTRSGTSRSGWVHTDDLRPATVGREQRWADHGIVSAHRSINIQRDQAQTGQHGSLGQMIRAMSTSSGSAVVPEVWAGNIIDRARNLAAVLRAGAEIVPMNAKTVNIGRLTGDPTAEFRAENSTITASDPTFDNVTLDAKTMSALVVGSIEWFQDSDVDAIVENALAQAFANQLDLVALYGSITSGAGSVNLPTPPNPRGVLGALNALASSSVLGGGTNGTAQTTGTYYDELVDLLFTPQDFNEKPNALIWNAKAARQYVKAYDTTGQPLRAPEALGEVDKYVSNQIPSYTKGTMTNRATDVFVGDWRQLLIGQRLGMTVQTLTERYAENGQIGIVVHWRGDVAVARPRAFSVYKALQGAS